MIIALHAIAAPSVAQRVNAHSNTERGGVEVKQVPGRKIGNVTTQGNIILLELDEGVIANHNLFDLGQRTIRFTPAAGGFRAANMPLQWDTARGSAMQGNTVRLTKFSFPFSGRNWDSLQVQATGIIGFGGGYNDLGFDRFVPMQTAGPKIVNKIPLIAAFLKLRMNGTRYVNELADRLVVTWDVSEPTGGQQDVTFTRTPNHFQAVLYRENAPVPFPFSRPVEASIMGGANWKENGDGTFTLLANGTMNPASGFSYLELYLMGFLPASGVPGFFVLRNQRMVGRSPEGNAVYSGEKIPITIQDVIAHNGPRVPSFENAPKEYNTAIVAVTLHGQRPSAAMISQLEGISAAWVAYWSKVTGGVSTMTTSVR